MDSTDKMFTGLVGTFFVLLFIVIMTLIYTDHIESMYELRTGRTSVEMDIPSDR